jgi:hypothetical protein
MHTQPAHLVEGASIVPAQPDEDGVAGSGLDSSSSSSSNGRCKSAVGEGRRHGGHTSGETVTGCKETTDPMRGHKPAGAHHAARCEWSATAAAVCACM